MKRILFVALSLAACRGEREAPVNDTAGSRLEAAASNAGLIVDSGKVSLIGAWSRDTDHVCIVPRRDGTLQVGARVDYGPGQGCAARGTATRSGEAIRITFGACRFDARFDGGRLIFPGEVPGACDRLCTGRASLAALAVDHLSMSLSEAATLRSADGEPLCPS